MSRAMVEVTDGPAVRIGVYTSRRERTTSTVLLAGHEALLIDPAWDPDELAALAADLVAAGVTVTAGFATHAHHDHVLWHPALGPAPRWASAPVARAATAEQADLVAALGPGWPAALGQLVGRLRPVTGSVLAWPKARTDAALDLQLVIHNAHAPGHTAVWLPTERVLIAGDMLSDVELPLLEQSTPDDYADGLELLQPYVDQAKVVIPGHGSPAIGAQATLRWAADRRYLDALHRPAPPHDDRLGMPGMAEAHRENRRQAAQTTT